MMFLVAEVILKGQLSRIQRLPQLGQIAKKQFTRETFHKYRYISSILEILVSNCGAILQLIPKSFNCRIPLVDVAQVDGSLIDRPKIRCRQMYLTLTCGNERKCVIQPYTQISTKIQQTDYLGSGRNKQLGSYGSSNRDS